MRVIVSLFVSPLGAIQRLGYITHESAVSYFRYLHIYYLIVLGIGNTRIMMTVVVYFI